MSYIPTSIFDLLKNKDLIYLFREYLHEQYNHENLSFWLEVESFRTANEEDIPQRFAQMYEKYFNPSSKYELNLESKFREQIEQNKEHPTREIFDEVQKYIFSNMQIEFPTFLQSAKFRKFKG